MEEEIFNPSLAINIDKNPQDAIVGNWYYVGCPSEHYILTKRTGKFFRTDEDDTSFICELADGDFTRTKDLYPLFPNNKFCIVEDFDPLNTVSVVNNNGTIEVGDYCYCLDEEDMHHFPERKNISGIYRITKINTDECKFECLGCTGEDGWSKACLALKASSMKNRAEQIGNYLKKYKLSRRERFDLINILRKEIQ